jgi:transposase-like protein
VISCAVLLAIGVNTDGHRSVLGCSVSFSEAEVHWREFWGAYKLADRMGWS